MAKRNYWTREEMILALNLYMKMPFGNMRSSNPLVQELAKLIGRNANAVAMRLSNYASCDPKLKARGVNGLAGGGKLKQEIWDEFENNKEQLLFESEQILARLQGTTIEDKFSSTIKDIPTSVKGEDRKREIKTRVNQSVFRTIVLANYNSQCALTGIDIPELLVASHIIPWAENKAERLNPANGICLSSLYDKAFDKGLISFDDNEQVLFSDRLTSNVGKEYFAEYFEPIRHKKLMSSQKYQINQRFLEWHRDCVFNK